MGLMSRLGSGITTGLSVLGPISDFSYGYTHGGGLAPAFGAAAGSYLGIRGGGAVGKNLGQVFAGGIHPRLRGVGGVVGGLGGSILGSIMATQGAIGLLGNRRKDDPHGLMHSGLADFARHPEIRLPPMQLTKSGHQKQASVLGRVINNATRNLAVSIASKGNMPLQHASTLASGIMLGGGALSAFGASQSGEIQPRNALHRATMYGRALGLF